MAVCSVTIHRVNEDGTYNVDLGNGIPFMSIDYGVTKSELSFRDEEAFGEIFRKFAKANEMTKEQFNTLIDVDDFDSFWDEETERLFGDVQVTLTQCQAYKLIRTLGVAAKDFQVLLEKAESGSDGQEREPKYFKYYHNNTRMKAAKRTPARNFCGRRYGCSGVG
ncbi:expressed unknown protein [Seminavis robusta]|uniref:Uncharacterized protein n=1 Tax=Seminavis robusta TaxID=568900 RepID=A0A9N8HW27_9STRA|nr:expressed unknown protein [Seminavis robusta]|eukprot:Sro2064_g313130.1 n/a (165) ;mRNA; f:6579-7073